MKPLTQRAMEPTKASFATVHWDQEVESAAAPDGGWQYDPNSGLFFSVAAQAYWDAKSKMFERYIHFGFVLY